MGLFKKKDGSPSLFGKITKGVLGVAGVAASVLPGGGIIQKAASKISGAIGSASNAIRTQSGGMLNVDNLQQRTGESVQEYLARLQANVPKVAGGMLAGGANASVTDGYIGGSAQQNFVAGATQSTVGKYTPYILLAAIAAVGGILIFKKR